jgi:catechol 2,3-dioxygenase-like lactoylglutathione lyase family enzyme
MQVIRLQFAYHARDFDASVLFYETILGLQRIGGWDRPDGRGAVLSAGGNAAIEIYGSPVGEPYHGTAPTGMDLVFQVDDVDGWYERLRAVPPGDLTPPTNTDWGGRNFYLTDPDGIRIEFFSHLTT